MRLRRCGVTRAGRRDERHAFANRLGLPAPTTNAPIAEDADTCDTCSGECRIWEESQPGGHKGGWVPCPDCDGTP